MGGLISLLSGGSDYGAAQDKQNMLSSLAGASGDARQFNTMGGRAYTSFQADDPAYRQAAAAQLAEDQRDPFTDQFSASALARARAGAQQNYQRSAANLAARYAQTGMTAPGGGPSSVAAGGYANLEAANANGLGQAQNDLAYRSIAEHQRRLADATNLTGGMANQDWGRANNAYGSELGANMGVAGAYGNLYQGDVARQQSDANGVMGLLGDAANVAGMYYGGGFGGAAAKGLTGGATGGGGGGGGFGGYGSAGVGMYRNNPNPGAYQFTPALSY